MTEKEVYDRQLKSEKQERERLLEILRVVRKGSERDRRKSYNRRPKRKWKRQ